MTNISYMFHNCDNLTIINVENWNTSNITNMYSAFGNCYNLTDINVDNWNMINTNTINYMFTRCNNLIDKSIDSIINMCLNCNNVLKDLRPTSQGIFNSTNITNDKYQNRWEELTAAGWIY